MCVCACAYDMSIVSIYFFAHILCHFFSYNLLKRCLMPSTGPDQCAYYHALFSRDKPELIGAMTPK